MKKVAVVGAGVSGLSAAYFLSKSGFKVEVFERNQEPGGLIGTKSTAEGLVESAANAFIDTELLREVSKEIGVELFPALKHSRKRYIFVDGKARRWPIALFPTLKLLLRLPFLKKTPPHEGETLADWGTRALGSEVSKKMLSPAIQGIYAGDARRMSASLILSRLFAKKKPSSVKRQSVSPREGMGAWILALQNYLAKQKVKFHFNQSVSCESLVQLQANFDVIILAASASGAAELLSKQFPGESSQLLKAAEMLPLTSVTVFCEPDSAQLQGFGVLFARSEGVVPMGVLFNADIFAGRSSLRSETWIFAGTELSENELQKEISATHYKLYGKELEIRDIQIKKWPQALPYYSIELEKFLKESFFQETLREKNIYLVGNYLGRIGLSDLLERSQNIVKELVV